MFGSVLLNACLYSCKAKFNTGVYLTCVLKILIGVVIKGKTLLPTGCFEKGCNLPPKESFGSFFERNERSRPMVAANTADLINASDYVFLYGVGTDSESCEVFIYYDNKRLANQVYRHKLETNEFVMFPATQLYHIENNNNRYLNYIQTILFKWV